MSGAEGPRVEGAADDASVDRVGNPPNGRAEGGTAAGRSERRSLGFPGSTRMASLLQPPDGGDYPPCCLPVPVEASCPWTVGEMGGGPGRRGGPESRDRRWMGQEADYGIGGGSQTRGWTNERLYPALLCQS